MQLAITLTLRLAGQAQGACSAASDWKLTVDPDNATLRIRYEVDSDVDGEMWLFGINSGNGVPIATAGSRVQTALAPAPATRRPARAAGEPSSADFDCHGKLTGWDSCSRWEPPWPTACRTSSAA